MFEEENGRKHPKFSNLLFLSKIHIFSRSFVRQKNKVRLKKLLVLFTQSKCSLVAYQKEHGCLQGRCVLWFYLMLCMAAGNHPFKKKTKQSKDIAFPIFQEGTMASCSKTKNRKPTRGSAGADH